MIGEVADRADVAERHRHDLRLHRVADPRHELGELGGAAVALEVHPAAHTDVAGSAQDDRSFGVVGLEARVGPLDEATPPRCLGEGFRCGEPDSVRRSSTRAGARRRARAAACAARRKCPAAPRCRTGVGSTRRELRARRRGRPGRTGACTASAGRRRPRRRCSAVTAPSPRGAPVGLPRRDTCSTASDPPMRRRR